MSVQKTHFITLGALCIVLLLSATVTYYFHTTPNDKANSQASASLNVSDEQPYTNLNGDSIDFESFKGMIRVVNSWASWNPFSVQELKDLETLAHENPEVAVIAINRKEPKEQAVRFLKTIGEFENIHFAIDLTDAFYTSIGGYAMPETVVYDAQGAVISHIKGVLTLEQMRSLVHEAKSAQ